MRGRVMSRPAPSQSEAERAFAEALSAAGLQPGPIQANTPGFVRFDAPGDKKGKGNGFYKLKLGDYPVGWYGDWKSGTQHQWLYEDPAAGDFTEAERNAIRREQARLRQEAEVAREVRQAEAAAIAVETWGQADPDATSHPYLTRKGIRSAEGLRLIHEFGKPRLLVPMSAYDMNGEMEIVGLQRIWPDGGKFFLTGQRTRAALFRLPGKNGPTILCEGVATAFSIWQATGLSVVAAFNAGNLLAVARELVRWQPSEPLIVAGDDDAVEPSNWAETSGSRPWINEGRVKAQATADAVGAAVVFPIFGEGPARERTDFNDLARAQGEGQVDAQIGAAIVTVGPKPSSTTGAIDAPAAHPHAVGFLLEASEHAVAKAFCAQFRDRLRYDHKQGAWFEFTGTHWQRDERRRAFDYARHMCVAIGEGKKSLCRASVARGVEAFAQADPAHAVDPTVWDQDAYLLGTPGGTVDLHSGRIQAAKAADHISKITSVAPESGRPDLWLRFIDDVTNGDKVFARYLQQVAGYSLTGDTREHALFFIFGVGKNGKSVFLNTLTKLLADYAVVAAMETFTAAKGDRHSTELARLHGARLVTASETEENRSWAEARMKQLTGGDPIAARYMRQDFFTFTPKFKLLIVGNHQPVLHDVSVATRRRFNMIPFAHIPVNPDTELERKLVPEYGRILAWMIDGCLDWQRNGLIRPAPVDDATEEYFDAQDLLGQWLEDCCVVGKNEWDTPGRLFESWTRFARAAGEEAGSAKSFGMALKKRHFVRGKSHGVRNYRGLSVKASEAGYPDDRMSNERTY